MLMPGSAFASASTGLTAYRGVICKVRTTALQAPLDACGVMETMNDSHVKQLLPRCVAGDDVLERFRTLCLDSKVRKTCAHSVVPMLASSVLGSSPPTQQRMPSKCHRTAGWTARAGAKQPAVSIVTRPGAEPDGGGGAGAAAVHQRAAVQDPAHAREAGTVSPGAHQATDAHGTY